MNEWITMILSVYTMIVSGAMVPMENQRSWVRTLLELGENIVEGVG